MESQPTTTNTVQQAGVKMTTLQLTEEDAKLFIEFRKYQEQFRQLLEDGVFAPLNGAKIIHKNGLRIRIIETRIVKRF